MLNFELCAAFWGHKKGRGGGGGGLYEMGFCSHYDLPCIFWYHNVLTVMLCEKA